MIIIVGMPQIINLRLPVHLYRIVFGIQDATGIDIYEFRYFQISYYSGRLIATMKHCNRNASNN